MKRFLYIFMSICIISISEGFSQQAAGTEVYLITCGPGTETYSIYGHSALRVVNQEKNFDTIYNWGIFDFDAPNFAWNFAKGRLEYRLAGERLDSFLSYYNYKKRYVIQQKVNLDSAEISTLLFLIDENLKPENVRYKYDFFYDDCSTRIRDLLEKSLGNKLLYPPDDKKEQPTFRNLTDQYQDLYPWLKFGIDLIMGSPGEKEADFRERMFLPIDMMEGLSEAIISRNGKMVPLLANADIILDFPPVVIRQRFLTSPASVMTIVMIVIIISTLTLKNVRLVRSIDILVFVIFSLLSVLMLFFNFFTDHLQMRWNLNIIWLSPLIPVCLLLLLLRKKGVMWFRSLFYVSAAFLLIHPILPQEFNIAFIPLVVILIARSAFRSEFEWLPRKQSS